MQNYLFILEVKLLESVDIIKDQTFFLSQVNQEPLQRCMFPLANYQKTEVKKIAMDAGLDIVAQKDESMGICFIGTRTFQNFIAEVQINYKFIFYLKSIKELRVIKLFTYSFN